MNFVAAFQLNANEAQAAALGQLQQAFARLCNAITPQVSQTRCWNRVALHHMVYHQLRKDFPGMGSQMICNAIYAVSRAARVVYQHPRSPFRADRYPAGSPLPRLQFGDDCPVYFDSHTLTIKDGRLSLYTMQGRLHFDLGLTPAQLQAFANQKLRSIVMVRQADGRFSLRFSLQAEPLPPPHQPVAMPDYLHISEPV